MGDAYLKEEIVYSTGTAAYSGGWEITLPQERTRLVRLCTLLTGDSAAAEDLAQETLVEAWRTWTGCAIRRVGRHGSPRSPVQNACYVIQNLLQWYVMNDIYPPDYVGLYVLASTQAGYFTTPQAREHGVSWRALTHHVTRGRFRRVRRGLYRFRDYPSSLYEDVVAAWLASSRMIRRSTSTI